MKINLTDLPDNLPVPEDDGAADHLVGNKLPDTSFRATNGARVNIAQITSKVVIYVYPMTGRPDTPLSDGWDEIPGARGCTPQSCSFRDHYAELQELNTNVFGLSAQTSEDQKEAKERLHLPFELLSDEGLSFKSTLRLPTFEAEGMELYKRITLIANNSYISKVFYPIFPPNENAEHVLSWLRAYA